MANSAINNTTITDYVDGENAINPDGVGQPIGNDKLLSINDVANILCVCPVTASLIMKDTGHSITIRRRVYILESSLLSFFHKMEG